MAKNLQTAKHDWSVAQLLRKPELTPAEWARARAEQVAAIATLAPLFLMTQLLTAGAMMLSFWTQGAESLLSTWAAVLSIASGLLALGYRLVQRHADSRPLTEQHLEASATAMLSLGVIWGALPVLLTPYVDPVGQRTLGVILSGMIFVGGFMMSRIPSVASSFIWPIAIGIVISLQLGKDPRNDLLSIVTLVHASVVAFCMHLNHRVFLDELNSRISLSQQSEVIGILLRDFGESTSDWLWQTAESGLVLRGAEGVEGLENTLSDTLAGRVFLDLFERTEACTVLERCFQRRQGFRDLVLQLRERDGAGDPVWWQLTGKPIYEDGQFAGFRGVASDITASKRNESRVAYMARYDGLTGLPNRMTLHETMAHELEMFDPAEGTLALVLLDLDNFKWVNDTLGHPAGDALLKKVAERLAGVSEEADLVSRLGGDEFALLVRRSDRAALTAWLAELVTTMATPYDLWGSTVLCSASVGVREVAAEARDPDTLLKHVDLALYHAKAKGKGRWEAFTGELEERARLRRQIEDDLQTALESDQIRVHFQPQIDARTSKLVACEALLRWEHPERGMIMPGAFITHAEDTGLIGQLGEWAIRASLRDAMRLPEYVKVAVNMSPLQIHSSGLIPTIVNALAQTGIAPERLELEITESVLISDTDFALDRLHKIKDLGVRIALDDFGTGYSSLSYLRAFPFDKIKIDQIFVKGLETSADNRAITKATIALAKSLNMGVMAEGVETEFQRQFLAEHGVDLLQGWLISKAVPIDGLSAFVRLRKAPPAGVAGGLVSLESRRPREAGEGRKERRQTARAQLS
jgi:diguanylate cyclase (GGDEF)-like protein